MAHGASESTGAKSILASLTLLTLAGTLQLGLAAASGRPLRKAWGYLAGLSLAAFWLTREEGIWLLPSAGLPLLYGAIVAIRRGEFDRILHRFYVSDGSDENLALFYCVALGEVEPTLRERFGVRTQLGGWVVSPLGACRTMGIVARESVAETDFLIVRGE